MILFALRSLLEAFQLTDALGGSAHHAVAGTDTGHRATIRVVIKIAVGIPKLDPSTLSFQQLSFSRWWQFSNERLVGFVEPGILQFIFFGHAVDHVHRNATGLVHTDRELFA